MGSSSSSNAEQQAKEKELTRYLPLYKAVLEGDWDTTENFLDVDPNSITARLTEEGETTLHIAALTRKANHFFSKLLDRIPRDQSLETLVDEKGYTLLHCAAVYGNMEAAKILVDRNPNLTNIWSQISRHERLKALPLHAAALNCHRELTLYLYSVTKEDVDPNPFTGRLGVWLANSLIYAEFYDMALQLFRRNSRPGTLIIPGRRTPLDAIAQKSSAFPSGAQYKPWQWFIYSRILVKSVNISGKPGVYDLENPCECNLLCTRTGAWARFLRRAHFIHVCQKFHHIIWSIMEVLVPQIKEIKETKHKHSQTLELVRCLCTEISSLEHTTARSEFIYPVHLGAKLGIHEVVEEILESFPAVGLTTDKAGYNIFHFAVMNRHEKVFNLLYQLGERIQKTAWYRDKKGNNILHFAGKLAPSHRINLVSGAALQMQRELQWYKEVTKWVAPCMTYEPNHEGKTPSVIFTEEHAELIKEGERWMKDNANSCSLAAALIATIAFAAAITVPGGTSGDSGFPIFSREATFIVFAISNAMSLFSSTASLLMFLSILTARYAEDDFLFSLPRRLIIGLITLFLSITSMMIAFSATLYLVVGNRSGWALVAVAVSACFPVTLFVSLQFPLLLDMIRYTYGSVFGLNKG